MMNSDDTLIDLSAIWNVIWSGRWLIALGITLGVFCAGYLAFARLTPTYSASSVLALESQPQKIEGIREIVTELPLAGPSRELVLFTQLEVLRSRSLMKSVVKDIDLTSLSEFSPPKSAPRFLDYILPNSRGEVLKSDREHAVDFAVNRLLEQVQIDLIPNSFAFKVTAHSTSPVVAQKIANVVSAQYIQAQLDTKSLAVSQAQKWLETRVTELQNDVAINEQRVKQFDARIDVLTEGDLKSRAIKLKELRARAKAMNEKRSFIALTQPVLNSDPTVQFKSGDVANIQTSTATNNVKIQPDFGLPTANRIDTNLASLNVTIEHLSNALENQTTDLLTLEQIKREADASKNLYEFFLSRLKETSIQQGIQRPDSRILSMAILPQFPSSPNKILLLILGALCGGTLAMIWLFLRHATRRSFLSPGELASVSGLAVMGAMPKRSTGIATTDAARELRTRVMAALNDIPTPIIMCTSSNQNTEKSQTARQLAQQMTGLNMRTLFMDCDFRSHPTQALSRGDASLGLADILTNVTDVHAVIKQSHETYDHLPSGVTDANPIDLFAGAKFTAMLTQLRTAYDCIIIDAPPVLLFAEAGNIGTHCDATLLSIVAGKTPREYLGQSIDFLASNGVPLTGLILESYDPKRANNMGIQREQRRYLRSIKPL